MKPLQLCLATMKSVFEGHSLTPLTCFMPLHGGAVGHSSFCGRPRLQKDYYGAACKFCWAGASLRGALLQGG
eukprot:72910-Amphidinium_carterae.1